ncbi:hypothetical protein FRC01_005308 [Tulasnella sp. 417]|nr:hypothetical protein FRC01_005308 [Tulasnella sp. 417]
MTLAKDGTYFAAGKYNKEPQFPLPPDRFTKYDMVSNNIGGGVNGGNAWVVTLDDGTTWNVSIGWIAPVEGPTEAGVAESSNPQDGNKIATVDGNRITSTSVYKGKEGQNIRFTASATPHESWAHIVYGIRTVPANVEWPEDVEEPSN